LQVGKSGGQFEDNQCAKLLSGSCLRVCQLVFEVIFFFTRELDLLEIWHDFTAAAGWSLAGNVEQAVQAGCVAGALRMSFR